MIKEWSGNDDEFFKNLFAYLKEKFSNELPETYWMQNNINATIYHETIVALEDVHTILRKIENGSSYKRADYEEASKKGDDKKVQEIIDFYKKLAFVNKVESSFAFNRFNEHYHWDSRILQYSAFVRQSDSKLYEEFKSASTWNKKNFNSDLIFGFVAAYKDFALDYQPTSKSIEEDISKQNELCKRLIENYDELLSQNIKIGVSVFDIVLPSSLRKSESRDGFMSTDYLEEFIQHLEFVFSRDDGILMTVNHAHIVSKNKFILSFLLIYKTKNYTSPQDVFDYYNRKVSDIVGHIGSLAIILINRHDMIKKIYPDDHFIGELKAQKQKIAFREKFLKYFLSSIFLLQADKGTELEDKEIRHSLFLNDFRYYKEKIYLEPVRSKSKKILEPVTYVKKRKKRYLSELVDDIADKKLDKYFALKGLSSTAIERIKLIEYLYREQAITMMVRPSVLEELVKIECFLTRLMYSREYYGFASEQIRRNFEESPKLEKLPLLLQQLVLLSYRSCLQDGYALRVNLRTDAIFFIDKFKNYFPRSLLINDTARIEKQLLLYKNEVLQPTLKREKRLWRDFAKKEEAINTFLLQAFEKELKDVIAFRFIFQCGVLESKSEAKLFDEMFRDYIDNLKRRSTAGVHLLKHVAVYIPYGQSHFIDATLLFQQSDDTDPNDIKDVVAKYWKDYVKNKDDKIEKYYKNASEKGTANQTNQFEFFRNKNLRATAVCVIKTEPSLNQQYVEIFHNDRKTRRLFIEKVSKFYAYSPLILVDELDLENLPKANCVILGRIRGPHKGKADVQNKVVEITEDQSARILPRVISETRGNQLSSVQEQEDVSTEYIETAPQCQDEVTAKRLTDEEGKADEIVVSVPVINPLPNQNELHTAQAAEGVSSVASEQNDSRKHTDKHGNQPPAIIPKRRCKSTFTSTKSLKLKQ